jgi:predicted PurR-regulated permease PerM
LGIDALAHGINETEATHVITTSENLSKFDVRMRLTENNLIHKMIFFIFQKILNEVPRLTHIIVISNKFTLKKVEEFKQKHSKVQVLLMEEIESLGQSILIFLFIFTLSIFYLKNKEL